MSAERDVPSRETGPVHKNAQTSRIGPRRVRRAYPSIVRNYLRPSRGGVTRMCRSFTLVRTTSQSLHSRFANTSQSISQNHTNFHASQRFTERFTTLHNASQRFTTLHANASRRFTLASNYSLSLCRKRRCDTS